MTKEEILQAIEETIVPNNQKAITAESLKILLTEMVNAGGSGSGVLTIYLGEPIVEGDAVIGVSLIDAEKEHNASIFQAIKSSTIMSPIAVDQSRYYTLAFGASSEHVKSCIMASFVVYADSEAASIMGLPYEAIILDVEGLNALLLSDGSIELRQ